MSSPWRTKKDKNGKNKRFKLNKAVYYPSVASGRNCEMCELSLTDYDKAEDGAYKIFRRFADARANNYKDEMLRLKRALVSAMNKAQSQGNYEISTLYGKKLNFMTMNYQAFPVRTRLMKKLGYTQNLGWYERDTKWHEIPLGIRKELVKEAKREQKIIDKFRGDDEKIQMELVYDHAKRLISWGVHADKDNRDEASVVWAEALEKCRFQYRPGTVLSPFSRAIDLTEEYIDKVDAYQARVEKKRSSTHVAINRFGIPNPTPQQVLKVQNIRNIEYKIEKLKKKSRKPHKIEKYNEINKELKRLSERREDLIKGLSVYRNTTRNQRSKI